MLRENFNNRSQKGASFVEYAIAVSALLAIFIVVNSFIKEAFERRARKVIETSDDMTSCEEVGSILRSAGSETCL